MRLNTLRAKEIMDLKGIAPDTLAFSTGMTERTIDWILRNGFASDDALDRIASALDVSTQEIYRPDWSEDYENEIEFLKGDNRATVTFSQARFVSKIKQLAEEYPDDVKVIADNKNKDGNTASICASLPVSWIVKPGKPKELSEEQKAKALLNLKQARTSAEPERNQG